jgi:hypothetical protein
MIPNGIQSHYLWQMDGRTWIEVSARESRLRELAIGKGWCIPIPQDKLVQFINTITNP